MRKLRRISAVQLQNCKLINAFVFTIWIVHVLFLHLKCQASSLFLRLYRRVCVAPGRKPKRLFFLCHVSFLVDHWYGVHQPFSKIFSETAESVLATFHVGPQWEGVTKECTNGLGHMIKMATLPIKKKTSLKINLYQNPKSYHLETCHLPSGQNKIDKGMVDINIIWYYTHNI